MMKFKGKSRASKEPQNLRRFKASIEEFTEKHESDWAKIHGMVDGGVTKAKGKSRKQLRKEGRKLKKMRKTAFKQHKELPTAESIAKEKEDRLKEERNRKNKEKKRQQERDRRKRKKIQKAESNVKIENEKDVRKLGLLEANKVEDKAIRQLEKQLKINKKKKVSKSLPQSFLSDGLDFILDVVDEDKLKTMYEDEEELNTKGWASEDSASGEEFGDDMELSDHGTSDEGDDADSGEDKSSSNEMEESDQETSSGRTLKHMLETQQMTKSPRSTKEISSNNTEKAIRKSVSFSSEAPRQRAPKSVKKPGKTLDNSDCDEPIDDKEMDPSVTDIADVQTSDEEASDSGQESDENLSDEFDLPDTDGEDDGFNKESESSLKEDIYGRLRDTSGNVVDSEASGGYIPPGKRLLMAQAGDEKKKIKLERMKKQLQGLINRLSESNMQPISNQIEEMFREHSRAELSEALASILINSCITVSLIPDRLIMEHVMLIAILHHNVGNEIGAQLIQTLGQLFNELSQLGSNYGEGKKMDNLLTVFSHLLNFKILHSILIFDILKKLADNFAERDIELILLVLKSVGFTLRKEDPMALKELIINVQSKASSVNTSSFQDSSRVKFMLEVILAIKNNNMRKIPNYDPTHLEHMKKMIRNYIKGSSGGDVQLRISLEDLLKAREQGRWWLVGSAWAGRDTDTPQTESKAFTAPSSISGVSSKILDMARKQRMNTDVRKTIFCILMTSEDYVDAFEKLLHLGLKHQQEKEIIHVIIDVCLQEKSPNPFYAFLCQKFCELDRRFVMTCQFSMWDRFSELEKLSDQQLTNLAALLVHQLANKALSLSVFKKIEFAELDKAKVRLMKLVLTSLLTDYPEHITAEVFSRIAPLSKLRLLHDGLRLFMQHFLLRNKGKSIVVGDSLKERVLIAEKALTSREGTSKL